MSGLAAVFHRDGRPAVAEDIRALTARIADRGPDGSATWLGGPVALGCARLVATPEAVDAHQPIHDPESHLALVFDGFLDDRPGLARALDLSPAAIEGQDDAVLVAAAYGRWRDEAFERLHGDFALVLWDEPARRLVCARDIMGLRPLCYHLTGNAVYCASTAGALAMHVGASVDEGTVAEHLCSRSVSLTRTLYEGVLRLPPGHLLVVESDRHRLAPYWTPEASREIRYARDEEYADDLRTRLAASVAARLRSPAGRPVGLMLSGGLDSGSICATAASQGYDLMAFTLGVADPELDETAQARATVDHVGGTKWTPVVADAGAVDYAAEAAELADIPTYPTGAASATLRREAAARGVRALLNGVGGDEWFFGNGAYLTDLLAGGRWRTFVRRWRAECALPGSAGSIGVWRDALWPLVPRSFKPLAQRLVRRRRVPRWIDPAFGRRTSLDERLRVTTLPVQAGSRAAAHMIRECWSPLAMAAREDQERFAARMAIEDRAPFYDRRIVEFALGLPESQRWLDGLPKAVLRRAMADTLPQSVLTGATYGDFSCLVLEGLTRVGWRDMVDELTIAERGWVLRAEVRKVRDAVESAQRSGGVCPPGLLDAAWAVASIELWHRGLAAHRAAFASPDARQ